VGDLRSELELMKKPKQKVLPRMIMVDPPKQRSVKKVIATPMPMVIDDRPILGYWDIRGLAQAIRYQLVYQGVDFIDQHLHHTEDVQSRQLWLD
jgi:hypothetical protein